VLGSRIRLSEPRMRITTLDSHVTDFQGTSECNSCFVTIQFSREILPSGRLIPTGIYSTKKLPSLKMTKWHAHVAHMAKHMDIVWGPLR